MHGMHAITDVQRIAYIEAEAVRHRACQHQPMAAGLERIRSNITLILRWIADVIEPTPRRTAQSTPAGSCNCR